MKPIAIQQLLRFQLYKIETNSTYSKRNSAQTEFLFYAHLFYFSIWLLVENSSLMMRETAPKAVA